MKHCENFTNFLTIATLVCSDLFFVLHVLLSSCSTYNCAWLVFFHSSSLLVGYFALKVSQKPLDQN